MWVLDRLPSQPTARQFVRLTRTHIPSCKALISRHALYTGKWKTLRSSFWRAQDASVFAILLKGISTSHEYYSPPHLRLKGDIDILIRECEIENTMRILSELGYELEDNLWEKYQLNRHHHLPGAKNRKSEIGNRKSLLKFTLVLSHLANRWPVNDYSHVSR